MEAILCLVSFLVLTLLTSGLSVHNTSSGMPGGGHILLSLTLRHTCAYGIQNTENISQIVALLSQCIQHEWLVWGQESKESLQGGWRGLLGWMPLTSVRPLSEIQVKKTSKGMCSGSHPASLYIRIWGGCINTEVSGTTPPWFGGSGSTLPICWSFFSASLPSTLLLDFLLLHPLPLKVQLIEEKAPRVKMVIHKSFQNTNNYFYKRP